jgi:hypothetical protein
MKFAIMVLASAFVLSSTFALAHTRHHKYRSGYSAAHSMSYGRYQGGYGRYQGGYGGYYGNPNNRGGLVGGSDSGTYRP